MVFEVGYILLKPPKAVFVLYHIFVRSEKAMLRVLEFSIFGISQVLEGMT